MKISRLIKSLAMGSLTAGCVELGFHAILPVNPAGSVVRLPE
jgi:hypothetical protein